MVPYWLRPRLFFLEKNSSRVTVVKQAGTDREVTGIYMDYDDDQIHVQVGPVVCSFDWRGVQNLIVP